MKYESIYILAPDLPDSEIQKVQKKVEELITKNNGKIFVTETWGKKRLAYPVQKRKYGFYILVQFEAPTDLIVSLEKFYRLSEKIIKFLTIKIDNFTEKKEVSEAPLISSGNNITKKQDNNEHNENEDKAAKEVINKNESE